jgi:ssDNA-binding Zn-finger/Zn-ribbon topoisomerase 1
MTTETLGFKWHCDRCGKEGVILGRSQFGKEPHGIEVFARFRHDSNTSPDKIHQDICQTCAESMIIWWSAPKEPDK